MMLKSVPRLSRALRRSLATQRFPVPAMGDSITEGTLLELTKKVGDYVAMEEVLAMVETDKVTVEVRSPAAGTITALMAAPDDNVLVGADFVEIDVGVGEATASAAAPASSAEATGAAKTEPSGPGAATITASRVHPSGKPSLISFPPRGAAELAVSAAPAQSPRAAATSPSQAAIKSTATTAASAGSAMSYVDLPARFKRQQMSEEEMECVDAGGAGYIF
jgi:2-oxoglutarate dehydrogenase E2 component (dihydrolipoamide succinyltransferase)